MPEDEKKKKKKVKDDNPFGLDDDVIDQINEQLKKVFENFSGQFPSDFGKANDPFAKMIMDILKQMNFDPSKVAGMKPDEVQDFMKKNMKNFNPAVFGFNVKVGPDGKPFVDGFGNVKPKTQGETEIKDERDPLVDIYEENGQIVVVVEVPGVKKEDIELRASPHELEINASPSESSPLTRKYHKIISLPGEIDPDVAKARYQNGILEVKLNKIGEKSNKKKVPID